MEMQLDSIYLCPNTCSTLDGPACFSRALTSQRYADRKSPLNAVSEWYAEAVTNGDSRLPDKLFICQSYKRFSKPFQFPSCPIANESTKEGPSSAIGCEEDMVVKYKGNCACKGGSLFWFSLCFYQHVSTILQFARSLQKGYPWLFPQSM